MVAVVSPELQASGVRVKSAYNSASVGISGIEPQYQDIRTIELEYGRNFNWQDEEQAVPRRDHRLRHRRAAVRQAHIVGEVGHDQRDLPYTVVGKIRKKEQDSNYSGPDNNKIFVPFATMARDMPRRDAAPGTVSDIIVSPKDWVVADLPRALDTRTRADRRHRLAARAERPRDSRPPPRIRSRRPARRSRCGTRR